MCSLFSVVVVLDAVMVDMHVCYFAFDICFFFFQAEDGIRDLVRSRGLGDVYKRQMAKGTRGATLKKLIALGLLVCVFIAGCWALLSGAVSYTHLTLPTIYSV
mgnify:CR=1 FL=1